MLSRATLRQSRKVKQEAARVGISGVLLGEIFQAFSPRAPIVLREFNDRQSPRQMRPVACVNGLEAAIKRSLRLLEIPCRLVQARQGRPCHTRAFEAVAGGGTGFHGLIAASPAGQETGESQLNPQCLVALTDSLLHSLLRGFGVAVCQIDLGRKGSDRSLFRVGGLQFRQFA